MSDESKRAAKPGEETKGAGAESAAEAQAQADQGQEQARADEEAEDAAGPEEEARAEQPTYLELLTRQVQEKDAKLREYIAAYKRAEDEFRRARERFERETTRTVELEKSKLVSTLFEVLDNFERSLDAAQTTKSYEALHTGVEMVYSQFLSKMQELGIERFSPEGEEFDPAQQDAMGVIPVATDAQHNKVIAVMRAGYTMGDRVLRPAMVQVGRKVQ